MMTTDFYFRTPLQVASFRGSHEQVQQLLKNATVQSVNMSDELLGHTALHNACYGFADAKVVRLLLDHKADARAQSLHGRLPLHHAANGGRCDVVQMLIDEVSAEETKSTDAVDERPNVNAKDTFGMTPLHACCLPGCSVTKPDGRYETAALLLKHGADRTVKDDKGRTALDLLTKEVDVDGKLAGLFRQ